MSQNSVDLVIRGGTLVSPQGRVAAGLAIQDGRIVAIEEDRLLPPASETIDARGLFVLPGMVDAHVHFRDPGDTDSEDWQSGSAAAACGSSAWAGVSGRSKSNETASLGGAVAGAAGAGAAAAGSAVNEGKSKSNEGA